jgi:4-amino-4-deoxy-L-arabinose transferase-like glycosyltransferase
MFWVGLIARELAIFIGHTYRISRLEGSFGFGWETGRIARSIALGQGFSSPFQDTTGPTAWLAPVYPYLLAGVFKVFGVYTIASAIAILSVNSIFSSLTIITVFYIARRVFGVRAALWSGWFAALFPYAWYWAIKWAWETSLATLLLSCVFFLSLRMAGVDSENHMARPTSAVAPPSAKPAKLSELQIEFSPRCQVEEWLLFGLLWALISLTNPSLLSWLPFCGVWLLVAQMRVERSAKALWSTFAAAAVCLVVLSPWVVRNYLVFHRFIPLRSNFGAELRMGNGDNAVGLWRFWMHPSSNVLERRKFQEMGEIAYVQMKKREALEFIRSQPLLFLKLCVKRAVYFWYGTPRDTGFEVLTLGRNVGFLLSSILAFGGLWAIWRYRHPARFLFGSLLFAVPLIYYVTFPHPRYRAPIEPEMLILMVGLFLYAEPGSKPQLSRAGS